MYAAQNEPRIELARERLRRSREQIFALAYALKTDYISAAAHDGFPRSRLMRALTGQRGRMLLGAAALAATMLRPSLLWRAGKFVNLLRPRLLRYVLPRLLR